MASARPPTPLTPLELLPFDILHTLLHSLDYASVRALSLTNSRLRASIHPDALCTRDSKIDFFLVVERYAQHADHLTCFSCFRILDKSEFADKHRKGRRGKGSLDSKRKRERFCWTCAAEKRLVPHLRDGLKRQGKVWFLCWNCGAWKTSEERCVEMPWGDADGGTSTFCEVAPGRVRRSRLERLPEVVMKNVLDRLGYRDRIMLAATGRGMRAVVGDPVEWGSVVERWEWMVKRKGWLNGFWRWRGAMACYGCWRWREAGKFSARQRGMENREGEAGMFGHRRRCNACLERFYGSGRGTEEGRRALERWRGQTVCGRCKKMKIVEEGSEGYEVCEGCERNRVKALQREAEMVGWGWAREKVVGETNMLEVEEDVAADFFGSVGMADPWHPQDNPLGGPEENLEDDDLVAFQAFMGMVEPEPEDWGESISRLMDWLDDLSGREPAMVALEEEPPSQTGSDATSVRTGFDVWLVYDRFFGGWTNKVTPDSQPGETLGESSSIVPPAVEAEAAVIEPAPNGEEPQNRHRRRFLSGQMTVAEQSLYMRIQEFVGRQRHRQQAERPQRSSTILELVAQRLRGLGFRAASRRTEVT